MKTGILLVNLGTPDSPAVSDVRKYLKQFLLDERVIDIPAFQRNLLVRGIIAPFRAPKSAKSYEKIWTREGSPLMVISQKFKELLSKELGGDYHIELAMRYQNPSIKSRLEAFKKMAIGKLIIFPMFPQYASATTGSVHQEVMRILSRWQTIPEIEFIQSYFDNEGMISAFREIGEKYKPVEHDHVMFSFHGLPERQILKADEHNYCLKQKDCCKTINENNRNCYSAQCHATARAIAGALNIPEDKYTVAFQSRLGKAEWIKPYSSVVLKDLGKQGVKKLLVFSPAFVADCLETIFEIGEEYKHEFKAAGGEELTLVEGLNTHHTWVKAAAAICRERG